MTNDEFFEACNLSEEWGIRRQTHVGIVDSWYDSRAIAKAIIEDGEELIHRRIGPTWVFLG
jgi:hypothetical protein